MGIIGESQNGISEQIESEPKLKENEPTYEEFKKVAQLALRCFTAASFGDMRDFRSRLLSDQRISENGLEINDALRNYFINFGHLVEKQTREENSFFAKLQIEEQDRVTKKREAIKEEARSKNKVASSDSLMVPTKSKELLLFIAMTDVNNVPITENESRSVDNFIREYGNNIMRAIRKEGINEFTEINSQILLLNEIAATDNLLNLYELKLDEVMKLVVEKTNDPGLGSRLNPQKLAEAFIEFKKVKNVHANQELSYNDFMIWFTSYSSAAGYDFDNARFMQRDFIRDICREIDVYQRMQYLIDNPGNEEQNNLLNSGRLIELRKSYVKQNVGASDKALQDKIDTLDQFSNLCRRYNIDISTLDALKTIVMYRLEDRSADLKKISQAFVDRLIDVLVYEFEVINNQTTKKSTVYQPLGIMNTVYPTQTKPSDVVKSLNPRGDRSYLEGTIEIYKNLREPLHLIEQTSKLEKVNIGQDTSGPKIAQQSINGINSILGLLKLEDGSVDLSTLDGEWQISRLSKHAELDVNLPDTQDNLLNHNCMIRKFTDRKRGITIIINVTDEKSSTKPSDFAIRIMVDNRKRNPNKENITSITLMNRTVKNEDLEEIELKSLYRAPQLTFTMDYDLPRDSSTYGETEQRFVLNLGDGSYTTYSIQNDMHQSRLTLQSIKHLASKIGLLSSTSSAMNSGNRTIGHSDFTTTALRYADATRVNSQLFVNYMVLRMLNTAFNPEFSSY